MSSKVIAACIVGGLVVIAGGLFFATSGSDSTQPSNNQTSETNVEPTQTYSKNEVSKHDSESDCWTIINGSVYDITSYIPRHPGGDNILSACGEDGTEFFAGEKAGQEGGTNDHSGAAKSQLAKLKVGELAQ